MDKTNNLQMNNTRIRRFLERRGRTRCFLTGADKGFSRAQGRGECSKIENCVDQTDLLSSLKTLWGASKHYRDPRLELPPQNVYELTEQS